MPRGRAKLTDKEERILVQAQLMGLGTESMVRIGNRLRALDKEREFRSKVDEAASGFSWTVKNSSSFTITDSKGKIYEVAVTKDYSNYDWNHGGPKSYADVTITHPGTRFKKRVINKHNLNNPWNDEIVSACPEKNKYLYRVMRDIKNGRFK
jgi:hypothetical protein